MENKNENYDDCTLPHFLLLFIVRLVDGSDAIFHTPAPREKKNEIVGSQFLFFFLLLFAFKKSSKCKTRIKGKEKNDNEKVFK